MNLETITKKDFRELVLNARKAFEDKEKEVIKNQRELTRLCIDYAELAAMYKAEYGDENDYIEGE